MRTYDYDVSFLGSRYGGTDAFSQSMKVHDAALRDEVVLAMKHAFGKRFGLFGRGWNEFFRQHDIEHVDQIVPLNRAHEVYWRSRVGLNCSLANYLEMYSSDRIFRVMGSGALLLTKRFPGMGTFGLRHGDNCLIWETADEAVQLARDVAAWREDAQAMLVEGFGGGKRIVWAPGIAEAGAKLARDHHTWDIRVLELLPYIDAVRAAR